MTDPRFQQQQYVVRRKVFRFLGGAFHVRDAAGTLLFYSEQKRFKLREDIRLYGDEQMREEILHIQARKIVDFSSAYDVIDVRAGEKVGALKRRGLKSIAQDHWVLMDAHDRDIGSLQEDNLALALLRRFIGIIPQHYRVEMGGTPVGTFRQGFNPFVYTLTLDFSADVGTMLDRRLGVAGAVLLAAIEGNQG